MGGQFFTPDNEPYRGSEALYLFDNALSAALETVQTLALLTRSRALSQLEVAAIDLVPTSISIAASVRELIRQAYVTGARILVRPLMERTATLDYIVNQPGGLDRWLSGWQYKERPKLAELLAMMSGQRDADQDMIKLIVDDFNSVVHADPHGCHKFIWSGPDGRPGYSASQALDAGPAVDEICMASFASLTIIESDAKRVFRDGVVKFAKKLDGTDSKELPSQD